MAIVNLKEKTIQVKIVYYGPGRSGKTTNLEYIHNRLQKNEEQQTSKLVSIDTKGDRTLFFDFFPIRLGKINGHGITTCNRMRPSASAALLVR